MSKDTKTNKTSTEIKTTISEEEIFSGIGKKHYVLAGLKEDVYKMVGDKIKTDYNGITLADVRTLYLELFNDINDILLATTIKREIKNAFKKS